MKLVPVPDMDFDDRKWAKYRVQYALESFWHSSETAVEVVFDPTEYVSVNSASATYIKAIRAMGLQGKVQAIVRSKHLYLLKVSKMPKHIEVQRRSSDGDN